MRVYLDNNATTRLDDEVFEAMMPYLKEEYGNPSNTSNEFGRKAHRAIENARETIAKCLHAGSVYDIIFTSGATESNNLAIRGIAGQGQSGQHIITSSIEHSSVMEVCRKLRSADTTYLGVDAKGLVSIDELKRNVRENTILISIMGANNEIGSIQPIYEISNIAKEKGILFHTDATQLAYWNKIDVENIDMLSLSAHKIHGPKGCGILYANQRARDQLQPLVFGGGQQDGLRSGTLNVPGIVGMAKALEFTVKQQKTYNQRIINLRNRLIFRIRQCEYVINGSMENRISGNLSISFNGATAAAMIEKMREIAVATGSACMSETGKQSHVLSAIGLSKEAALNTIRIGISKYTTEDEIDYAADEIIRAYKECRGIM